MYCNKYIFYDDYVELNILDKHNNILYTGKIDIDDYDMVSKYHWCRTSSTQKTYLRNNKLKLHLHVFILGNKEGFIVDHINRDRTDCRKQNLRHVTHQKNAINKGRQSNNTSGHVGVSWDKSRNKWESHIKLNNNKKHLGRFDNIDDAIEARLKAELKYFGFNVNREYDKYTVHENKIN